MSDARICDRCGKIEKKDLLLDRDACFIKLKKYYDLCKGCSEQLQAWIQQGVQK